MCHDEKKPFVPWADCDHPEAAADEDARWKWGLTENYVDGATVALAEDALPTRANRGIVSKTGDSVDVSRDSAEGIGRKGRSA